MQLGWSNYWELKNNSFVLGEAFFNVANEAGGGFGLDLTMNKYIKKTDTSPFYGAGIGWYMNSRITDVELIDNQYDYYNINQEARHGIALTAQVGYTFLRTYNTNIFARLKYHVLFTAGEGNIDNGISINVGLVRKLMPNKNASFGYRDRVEYRYPLLEILLGLISD